MAPAPVGRRGKALFHFCRASDPTYLSLSRDPDCPPAPALARGEVGRYETLWGILPTKIEWTTRFGRAGSDGVMGESKEDAAATTGGRETEDVLQGNKRSAYFTWDGMDDGRVDDMNGMDGRMDGPRRAAARCTGVGLRVFPRFGVCH